VEFAWLCDWWVQFGVELRLRLRHFFAFDGERSFFAVFLNHGVLRSFRLESWTAASGEVVVFLPPASLREENQLVLAVEQSVRVGVDEGLWTLVSSESSLGIPFERWDVEWSLADLPEPILGGEDDARADRPRSAPAQPRPLEATARSLAGLAAAWSGEAAAPRGRPHLVVELRESSGACARSATWAGTRSRGDDRDRGALPGGPERSPSS
jgi:hypothetical protein